MVCNTGASDQYNIRRFRARTEHLKQLFFRFCVTKWYKIGSSVRKANSIKHLKSMFKEFFNFKERSLFAVRDLVGVKLLSRLRLKFSHLNEHKFRENFKDSPSPMCDCGCETETADYFFLRDHFLWIKVMFIYTSFNCWNDLGIRFFQEPVWFDRFSGCCLLGHDETTVAEGYSMKSLPWINHS